MQSICKDAKKKKIKILGGSPRVWQVQGTIKLNCNMQRNKAHHRDLKSRGGVFDSCLHREMLRTIYSRNGRPTKNIEIIFLHLKKI